jgi:hypothetical protein
VNSKLVGLTLPFSSLDLHPPSSLCPPVHPQGANVSAVNKGSVFPLDILKYKDKLEILNEDKYPLHALIAHRCSLWLQIVLFASSQGDIHRVRSYISRYPQLAQVKDPTGREVTDMLDEKSRAHVMALLHWHGRYRLQEDLPLYSSKDTLVLTAVDSETVDDYGKPRKVVLKLMLNKDRYAHTKKTLSFTPTHTCPY